VQIASIAASSPHVGLAGKIAQGGDASDSGETRPGRPGGHPCRPPLDGDLKRLEIGIALGMAPELLLLDEATAGCRFTWICAGGALASQRQREPSCGVPLMRS
jgi:hypothetical protein